MNPNTGISADFETDNGWETAMYGGGYHSSRMHATTALSAIASARECLRDERTAFATFARRVADLEPSAGPATGGGDGAAGVVAMRATPADTALRRVRSCYRETVLDVRDDADERPLADHLASDFGRETAMAVANGNALSPPLRKSLVLGARRATDARETVLTDLDREEATLERVRALRTEAEPAVNTAEDSLLELDFDDLLELYYTLIDLESRAESLLEERQDTLRPGADTTDQPPAAIRTGVYGSLPVSHPVLADGATLVRDLRTAREQVSAAIARRD